MLVELVAAFFQGGQGLFQGGDMAATGGEAALPGALIPGHGFQVIAQRLDFKHYTHFASEVKSYFDLPPRQFQKSVRALCPET